MENNDPKDLARKGEKYLEKAILAVLSTAEECIGAAEISKRAGIYRERGVLDIMNDAIATGILVKLHSAGEVQQCTQNSNGRGGWELKD